MTPRVWLAAGVAALIILAGVLAWAFWPAKPIPEVVTAAPQIIQSDGSVIAERRPDAHPKPPPHAIPKGDTEERRGSVTAAPAAGASSVEVNYSLVREKDNGRRMVFSSPDGQITGAVDIPIEPGLIPPPPKPWAAGLSYSSSHAVGVWLERDVGRLRLGAEVARRQDGKAEAQVRVGVRW